MVKKKLEKKQAKKEIEKFFRNLKNKTANDIKKIKRLAMRHNIKLGKLRKRFCKYCFSPKLKVKSIQKGVKKVMCGECGKISRYKIKD